MKKLVLIFLLICTALAMNAQSIGQLSNVNIDNLDDSQVEQLMQKMQTEGISMNQLDQYAGKQGVKKEDITKLKRRIVRYNTENGGLKQRKSISNTSEKEANSDTEAFDLSQKIKQAKEDSIKANQPQIFGSKIFKDINLNFEPNLRLATPSDYILGPDDEVLIDIYGNSEASYKTYVSPEGKIKIPNVGIVSVGGLTIDEAKKMLTTKLASTYSGIKSKTTFVSITLGDIRSITVNVIGEVVYPGSYTIPSLASVFNALYQAGGPSENGSYRVVQVIRSSKVIAEVDLYEFIVFGKQNNLKLRDQDAIKVLPYQNRVTLNGKVKNPAIFEMKKGETLDSLLHYAGGFAEGAFRERITAFRNTTKEKSVVDVPLDEAKTFIVEAGDVFTVGELLKRFANRVQIVGAVYRPGVFALSEGMTAGDLIKKAEGLKEDAFSTRGVVFRKNAAGLPEIAAFNPLDELSGKSQFMLQREDSILIGSVTQMKENDFVYLSGEVVEPNKYPFAEGMTVKDLILMGSGFNNKANLNEVEVFRQISDASVLNNNVQKAESFKLKIDKELSLTDKAASFKLKREDRVIIRPIFGYEDPKEVSIDGEIRAPGAYILTSKNQRISDLIYKAGGVTDYAFTTGAFLIRQMQKSETEKKLLKQVASNTTTKLKKQSQLADSLKLRNEILSESEIVGIELDKILQKPGSAVDLKLEAGDVLFVPKYLETVKVTGEVLLPNTVRFDKSNSLRDYVDASGGFGTNAYIGKSYVIHASGKVQTTKHFLGFRIYPKIKPGSRIVIPERPERKGMTTAETITLTTSVISLALIVVTLFK